MNRSELDFWPWNSATMEATGIMRIGVYGGTFDPVHLAHLILAEQCRAQLELDEVWFVPVAISPHKLDSPVTSSVHRRKMLELAIADQTTFRVELLELERGGPSFTVDTLEQLTQMHPQHEWFLLIGADSLRDFPTWRSPERIVELSTIVAVNRGGDPPIDSGEFERRFHTRLEQVQIPGLDISATDLRNRVATGRSIRYLVPRSVEAYIDQQGLYRA